MTTHSGTGGDKRGPRDVLRDHRPATLRLRCACVTALCLLGASLQARAQRAADWAPQAPEDILPLSQFEDDPIGVDATPLRPAPKPGPAASTPRHFEEGFGPMPPPFHAREGEVLTAIPAMKETAHSIAVHLEAGLARVHVDLRFESSADGPAELRYRLAVPAGSTPARLRVCSARGCRDGIVGQDAEGRGAYDAAVLSRPTDEAVPLPVARLATQTYGRGSALLLQVAPVSRTHPLDVTLEYIAPTETHAGMTRLRLPRRGMDPRIVPAELSLRAPALLDARIDGLLASEVPATLDPRLPTELSARSERGSISMQGHHYPCDGGRCARMWIAAGSRELRPRDLFIALDLSPSMQGPARNRLPVAVAELLLAAPEGTRVRALGFAARAEALLDTATDAGEVPLAPLLSGIGEETHGSATRLEAVMPLVEGWLKRPASRALRPLLVIVGDGGLTTGAAAPLSRARRRGLEVAVLNLADRPTRPSLAEGARATGGAVVEAGAAALQARRGQGSERLREQLATLFAPTVAGHVEVLGVRDARGGRVRLPALRAGETRVWQGPVRRRAVVRAAGRRSRSGPADPELQQALAFRDGSALLAVDHRDLGRDGADWPALPAPTPARRDRKPPPCDPRGPAHRYSGLGSDLAPVAPALQRACADAPPGDEKAAAAAIGKGMPAEPLLGMLRDRIVPVARGCFRRDRAGRGDYAVRAVFRFRLSEREVVEAEVEGDLRPALRACLLSAIDKLEVPRFDGIVTVRYPLFTEREPAPAKIELSADAAAELDAVLQAAERAPSGRAQGATIP